MPAPQDAVMAILKRIEEDVANGFRRVDNRFNALEAKTNDIAENVLDAKNDIANLRNDMLMHLGLTAKHRLDFEVLGSEVDEIKARLAALAARS